MLMQNVNLKLKHKNIYSHNTTTRGQFKYNLQAARIDNEWMRVTRNNFDEEVVVWGGPQ